MEFVDVCCEIHNEIHNPNQIPKFSLFTGVRCPQLLLLEIFNMHVFVNQCKLITLMAIADQCQAKKHFPKKLFSDPPALFFRMKPEAQDIFVRPHLMKTCFEYNWSQNWFCFRIMVMLGSCLLKILKWL
jgi:hypothetical protein